MHAIFEVAVDWLNRLSYPRKFTLISILFVSPLLLTLSLLFSQMNAEIARMEQELSGTVYLRPLHQLYQHILQHRVVADQHFVNGGKRGDYRAALERQQAAIEQDFEALAVVDQRLGATLQTTREFENLREDWAFLKARASNVEKGSSDSLHTRLLDDVRALITHVGDTSQLVLIPDIDTYYLMDTVVNRLPEAEGLLGQVQFLGERIITRNVLSAEERTHLGVLSGLIEASADSIEVGMERARLANPQLSSDLRARAGASATLTQVFLEAVDQGILRRTEVTLSPEYYRLTATNAFAASFEFWDRAVGELEGLLQARIDLLRRRMALVTGVTLAGLCLVTLFWFAFYASFMRSISRLEQATQQMVSGDFSGMISLESQDELAQVATAFNRIASQLRIEWQQARDESARRLQAEKEMSFAKAEAEEANQAKSHFLANMSHELRTPLNVIIGYSEMLQEEALEVGHDSFVRDLQRIHRSGHHLLRLINDVLDLSKIEAGKMELHLEHFDVAAMLGDTISAITPLVSKNQNTFHTVYTPHLGGMYGDVTKVRQLLFNLLSNACKFTKNGTIWLEATREQGNGTPAGAERFVFRVRDSGIGMSVEQVDRLFQPFTQADAQIGRDYGGTGLGLALSKHLCQMMGGDILVESAKGQGSTFTIYLPVVVGASQDPSTPETQRG